MAASRTWNDQGGKKARCRIRIRFTLRGVLLFILLLGIGLAFVAQKRRQSERRAAAVSLIKRNGGQFFYAHQDLPNRPVSAHPFLRTIFGENNFYQARTARVTGQSSLAALLEFRELEQLILHGKGITDRELSRLREFPNLSFLEIYGTEHISSAGWTSIGILPKLRLLWLTDVPLTDDDLQHLPQLPNLRGLSIANTDTDLVKITGQGFRDSPDFPNLEEIVLVKTPICNSGLEQVARYRTVRFLRLSRTAVTGDGLQALVGQPSLIFLTVANSPVSDEAVAPLKQMTRLVHLELGGTDLSTEAIGELEELFGDRFYCEETVHHDQVETSHAD